MNDTEKGRQDILQGYRNRVRDNILVWCTVEDALRDPVRAEKLDWWSTTIQEDRVRNVGRLA